MRAKIGFLALIIGGAGLDGPDSTICAVIAVIGLIICLKESKKNRRSTDQSRNVYK